MITDTLSDTLEIVEHTEVPVQPIAPLDLTDEQVMQMVQSRNPESIGILHDRYSRLLKALIMKVLHNEAESDDLLQEVFLEIWDRAAGYSQEKGKALSWIVTLARRRAIDRLRKREAYCRMEDRLLEETKRNPQDSIDHVEEDVEHAEMREHLQRVMATLPPAQRQAIEMAYYRGMSQRDIAAETGIPLGTIKTRLELGMKKLTEALRGYEDLL
jgi:RNA polymerase sigma-70 factor (ECF subfamily)